MTNAQTLNVTTPADSEIVMTREFNAPRKLVFRAFTDPQLIPKWWGSRTDTTTVEKMEVKPGGIWRYVCKDREGNTCTFSGVYLEVVPPEKLVYTFVYEPLGGPGMVETVTFQEKNGKTLVKSSDAFPSKNDRDGMLKSGMEDGAAECFNRLDELLASLV